MQLKLQSQNTPFRYKKGIVEQQDKTAQLVVAQELK